MTPELLTVLWIGAVGAAILFVAFVGLVGFMYLLTAPWLFRRPKPRMVPAPPQSGRGEAPAADHERERRRRASVLAATVATAARARVRLVACDEPAWRLLHRIRRLTRPAPAARKSPRW